MTCPRWGLSLLGVGLKASRVQGLGVLRVLGFRGLGDWGLGVKGLGVLDFGVGV